MKFNKIISIAVVNGLTLLFFASFLASCQKNTIAKKGFLSDFKSQQNSRKVASSESKLLSSIKKHFDLKQVYIYCSINDPQVEKCYNENISKVLNQYEKITQQLDKKEKQQILNEMEFTKTKHKTEQLVSEVLQLMDTHIVQLVHKRENFCRVNSKFYIERCLKQYVEMDTMKVLNSFQDHHKNINGQEYLYLKNKIKTQFISKLDVSLNHLKNKEKKS